MRSVLYYEHNKKTKSLEDLKPIYHGGPFWAFWLMELFDRIAHFGLDMRFKIEDRFTEPTDKRRRNIRQT